MAEDPDVVTSMSCASTADMSWGEGRGGGRILVEWLSVTVTQRGSIASVEVFAAYGTVTLLRLR
jgi:hypothetical protein